MRNSKKNSECVKEKLTISIRRKSDKSVKIVTGQSLEQILHQLAINQKNDFSSNSNSGENLKRTKNLISSGSFSNNVNSLKNLTFPPLICRNKYESRSILLDQSVSNHRTTSRFPKQFLVGDKPNSAFKHALDKTSNIKKEKTVHSPEANTNPGEMEKKECEHNQFIKRNAVSENVQKAVNNVSKVAEETSSRICVIKEVFGNAVTTFGTGDDVTRYDGRDAVGLGLKDPQLIVPKKTDDITKIKGWRRKQFFIERPTTVEFHEFPYGNTVYKNVKSEPNNILPNNHVENAFTCESLDDFLEQDAKLKINYEIPHLFAEVGIKLTKEEIASAPSLSENAIKEVETKYCRSVPIQDGIINLDDTKTDKVKSGKRQSSDNSEESSKIVKLEKNNMRLVRTVKKVIGKETDCCNDNPPPMEHEPKKENNLNEMKLDTTDFNGITNVNTIKLMSKVLGLVVYPSPHTPLHPLVQFHLRKLRSYHTVVDSNWANFAASVVVQKDSKCERCILPVKCCVKVLHNPVKSEEKTIKTTLTEAGTDAPVEEGKCTEKLQEGQFSQLPYTKKFSVEELERMKSCRVMIKKLDITPGRKYLCLKHNGFNCNNCKNFKSILKPLSREKTGEIVVNKKKESEKPVLMASQPRFHEEDVVNLLAKKLKVFHPDSLTSIDSLKTLNPNVVELIKPKFIQKSFWHKYISIWYLKPDKADVKSRAFLTFSKTPPLPNAINLRCSLVVKNLPKVIREIVYSEKPVDPNEYVLLYCNGNFWEIHGSVNVTFNKSGLCTQEVIMPSESPELKNLKDMSFKLLKIKTVKWWVLDLTLKFQIIELVSENFIANISQKRLLEFIKQYSSGFMALRTIPPGRIFGAYVIQSLLPYVLIGPYRLYENHNLTFREDFCTLRFVYNEVKESNESSPLKVRISSAIKEAEKNGKTVENLWLHCRTFADSISSLEVITSCGVMTVPRSNYSIQDEHGYSLSSASLPDMNRKNLDNCRGNLQVEVYLYFNIFGLGYVLGVLEEDKSVTIRHPLNQRTKVNSTDIGNWFLGILRRRMRFVPKNLIVNWFITKYKSHLKNRPPFNKNFLNGAHILTKSGVFYFLKLSDCSINQGKFLKKGNILEAAGKSTVIEEVVYLKILSDMLLKSPKIKARTDEVLTAAVKEIMRLQKKQNLLERIKACLEEEKLRLFNSYLMTIHLKGLNKNLSVLLLKQIEKLFFSKSGMINETYLKKLKLYSFGRQYLKLLEEENWDKKVF